VSHDYGTIEFITKSARRRNWSLRDKLQMIEASRYRLQRLRPFDTRQNLQIVHCVPDIAAALYIQPSEALVNGNTLIGVDGATSDKKYGSSFEVR
jgi:hypothetical protein